MDKPSTLEEIYEQNTYWTGRQRRARKRRDLAEKTMRQCDKHLGVHRMVEQLRDLLQPLFPDQQLEVLGPFGLTNEMSIHAHVDDPDTKRGYQIVGSLSFRPEHDLEGEGREMHSTGLRLRLVDRNRTIGNYPTNSIGAMNGMQYAEVELPPTVEEIAMLLGASIAEYNARHAV